MLIGMNIERVEERYEGTDYVECIDIEYDEDNRNNLVEIHLNNPDSEYDAFTKIVGPEDLKKLEMSIMKWVARGMGMAKEDYVRGKINKEQFIGIVGEDTYEEFMERVEENGGDEDDIEVMIKTKLPVDFKKQLPAGEYSEV